MLNGNFILRQANEVADAINKRLVRESTINATAPNPDLGGFKCYIS